MEKIKDSFSVNLKDIPPEKWDNLESQADTIIENARADILLWENVKAQIQEFKKTWPIKTTSKEEEKNGPSKESLNSMVG